ncbi:MAG TPA: hypothetical protein VGR34_04545 [Candidatus Dormibacteraeota bacterium]|nr:hypothetical protein [Candidatus Dormibacteraeota bacterium]
MQSIKTVAIQLDKERHLLYDVNSLIDLGDELGINLMEKSGWEELTGKMETPPPAHMTDVPEEIFVPAVPSFKKVRAIVWAGLLHEDPTLTVRQVGAMLNPADLAPVVKAYIEAWQAQDVTESKDPNAPAGQGGPATLASAG